MSYFPERIPDEAAMRTDERKSGEQVLLIETEDTGPLYPELIPIIVQLDEKIARERATMIARTERSVRENGEKPIAM